MPAANRARLSVLIVTEPDAQRSQDAHAIAQALTEAGTLVLGVRAGDATLPEAVEQLKPDVVVVRSDSGVRDVLEHIAVATQHARRPIALFTNSEDRPTMREALGAGVSAYVVRGANRERVQSVIDVAVERFAAEEALREELASTKTELAHRFLQDLAMKKGIRLRDAAERVIDIESLLG
jgi:two-component system, response regulator / RNA-binding antiterminator